MLPLASAAVSATSWSISSADMAALVSASFAAKSASIASCCPGAGTVVAAQPTAQEAKLLGIARTDACLIVNRRTFSREAPITTARLVHPGHRFQLDGQFTP